MRGQALDATDGPAQRGGAGKLQPLREDLTAPDRKGLQRSPTAASPLLDLESTCARGLAPGADPLARNPVSYEGKSEGAGRRLRVSVAEEDPRGQAGQRIIADLEVDRDPRSLPPEQIERLLDPARL